MTLLLPLVVVIDVVFVVFIPFLTLTRLLLVVVGTGVGGTGNVGNERLYGKTFKLGNEWFKKEWNSFQVMFTYFTNVDSLDIKSISSFFTT